MDTENTQAKTIAEENVVRTSLNIPQALWRELKVKAASSDLSYTNAVIAAIRAWVSSESNQQKGAA